MQKHGIAIFVILTVTLLGVPTNTQASVVEIDRAVHFFQKRQKCDVWIATNMRSGNISNEVSCLFYGTVDSGSVDERTGCVWTTLDLDNGKIEVGHSPLIFEGERCTVKTLKKMFSSPEFNDFFSCKHLAEGDLIVGGKRALLPLLKKTFATCGTIIE
jgi:hypothetical protein